MIYFIFFLLMFLFQKEKVSIEAFFYFLIAFSGLSSFIIDRDIDYSNINDFMISIYSIIFLLILLYPIKYFRLNRINAINLIRFSKKFILAIHIFGSISFIFAITIFVFSYNYYQTSLTTVSEYKNMGEANALLKSTFSTPIILVRLFATLSIFLIPIHLIYFIRKKYFQSLLFLLYSFVLPISGLLAFSRSLLTIYLIVYVCLFIYFKDFLLEKINLKYISLLGLLIYSIYSINTAIAKDRFEDSYYYDTRISSKSLIQNKVIYSQLDYFSQWIQNGSGALKIFENDKILFGKSFSPLLWRLGIIDKEDFFFLRSKTLGEFSSTFNGIVAGYVYDFGFFISIVIVFLISTQSVYLSKYLQRKSQIYFQIFIVLYLMIPALFFAGNVFLYEFYSISILLFIGMYKFKLITT